MGNGCRGRLSDALQSMQQGTAESQGLAGACPRLPNQVGPAQRQWDSDGLDREWVDDARLGECGRDLFSNTKVCESLGSIVCLAQDENLTVRRDLWTTDPRGGGPAGEFTLASSLERAKADRASFNRA